MYMKRILSAVKGTYVIYAIVYPSEGPEKSPRAELLIRYDDTGT